VTEDCHLAQCLYVCLSQYKLLSVERDKSTKELELLKEENVSTRAKNSELETENQALELALRELHEKSKLCYVKLSLYLCLLLCASVITQLDVLHKSDCRQTLDARSLMPDLHLGTLPLTF